MEIQMQLQEAQLNSIKLGEIPPRDDPNQKHKTRSNEEANR